MRILPANPMYFIDKVHTYFMKNDVAMLNLITLARNLTLGNMTRQLLIRLMSLLLFSIVALLPGSALAQNAVVGTGFSTGWGGGSCEPGNGGFKFMTEVVSGTFGVTTTANGTGNQYWRFGIEWSGTTAQRAINIGGDVAVTPGTTYSLNSNCTTSGAMYYNVPNASYTYVFKTLNAGTNPTGQFVFFEVQGPVRSATNVTRSPSGNVPGNSSVQVTATLDGAFSAGQAVYLRYSNNGFASSAVVQMTGSGTTYSATIPAAANVIGTPVSYYVFTSGTTNVAADGSNADLYTINFKRNGAQNYTYTPVQGPTFGTIAAAGTYCEGTDAFFTVTGLRPSANSTLTYNINGGASADVVVAANGSGNGLFSVPAVFANDGLPLTVTQVAWNSMSVPVTTNNSAVFDITANTAVGGTTQGAAGVCAGNNSGTITLTGYSGTIVRWEFSDDNFATSPIFVSNTTPSISYTNLTATRSYRAVLVSGSCPPVNSSVTTISVSSAPNAGSVTGGTTVCGGSNSGMLILSGHSGGSIVRWESSTDNFATAPTVIANTQNFYAYNNVAVTTNYRAVVANGSCEANSGIATISIGPSTTWTTSGWSNGAPDSSKAAYFTHDYNENADIAACSINVSNGADVVIPSGYSVDLGGALNVEAGSTFTLSNNANLFQPDGVTNTSPITVKRNSSALKRLDYTLWSSPVAGMGMLAFSPLTAISPTVRFYNYNTGTNLYNSVSGISTAEFETGRGYLIRMPNNHPETATVWEGSFTGIPNNGEYNITMENLGFGNSFNLVGNPYPSPIDMYTFVGDNFLAITGTLYFWRKTNADSNPAYCTWNFGTFVDNGAAEVYDPLDIIRTGQGFFVEANFGETNLWFNNYQRINNSDDQFFRPAQALKHRIWLNLTGNNAFSQSAIVYSTDGTPQLDRMDGRYINDGAIRLTMKIAGSEYAIQSRGGFEPTDVVPMSYTVPASGSYSIAIDRMDGLFLEDQQVFLRDNVLGIVHDIKTSAYSFTTESGSFDGRFDILFQSSLAIAQPEFSSSAVVVYRSGDEFVVDAGNITLQEVLAYDMQGRLVAAKKAVNATSTSLSLADAKQVILLAIKSVEGRVVHKKVIN